MHIRTGLVLGLCVVLPASSFADFRYDETTKVTGGSLVSMAKFAGAFSKQARQITDPVNSTILVKGNRMAHINPDTTEIIDLDQETITNIDHAKKTYSVVTFQQMKAAMEEAIRKAQAQQKQAPPPTTPASTTPPPEMKFKVSVANTGAKKQVAGLDASESILRMTMEAKDQQSGQTGNMAITNDMWMAPEIPGYGEVRDFNSRMASKMGSMIGGATGSLSPQMLGMQPGMSSGMADMAKEMSKLKGVPVSQIMRMGTTANGAPLPAASEAPLPPSNGPNTGAIADQAAGSATNSAASSAASHISLPGIGNLGGFGFHKKKPDQPAAQPAAASGPPPNAAVLMESTVEMTGFSSAPVDATRLDVPAGYSKVLSEYQKAHQ
jgi:hypothetical protein